MKPVVVSLFAVALFTLAGCGASCEDYCSHTSECLEAIGETTPMTLEQCVTGCENMLELRDSTQDYMDCAVDVECEGRSADEIDAELAACAFGDREGPRS